MNDPDLQATVKVGISYLLFCSGMLIDCRSPLFVREMSEPSRHISTRLRAALCWETLADKSLFQRLL